MPLYEYKCEDCHELFSELRKVEDREAPIECPACGSEGRVLFSQFAHSGDGGSGGCGSCPPGST